MAARTRPFEVVLEVGRKKVIAAVPEYPGWAKIARDEDAALQALSDSAPWYAEILRSEGIDFPEVPGREAFQAAARVEGNATTDFGAPDAAFPGDDEPLPPDEVDRITALFRAYWKALDRAREAAAGKELRKGPRGGGRDLEKMMQHVLEAEANYLRQIGWKHKVMDSGDQDEELRRVRQAVLEAFPAAARGELPTESSRGNKLWTPRRFARRSGWHVLDHAWEIEDRLDNG